jgi:hypothetical protein
LDEQTLLRNTCAHQLSLWIAFKKVIGLQMKANRAPAAEAGR